jgi:hypothetical protein
VACTAGDGGFHVLEPAPRAVQTHDANGNSEAAGLTPAHEPRTPRKSASADRLESLPGLGAVRQSARQSLPTDISTLVPSMQPHARSSLPRLSIDAGLMPLGAKLAPLAPLGAKPLLGALGGGGGTVPSSPGVLAGGASTPERSSSPLPPVNGSTGAGQSTGTGEPAAGTGAGAAAPAGGEASALRAMQAVARLAQGDAVGAASCYLSVGDVDTAARALVRGSQVEMAAALMMSLPGASTGTGARTGAGGGGCSDAAYAMLAEKAVALGEWELAREAAGAISDAAARTWRLQLVCAGHRAVESDGAAAESFKTKCLSGGGAGGGDAAETAVLQVIAGDVGAAAGAVVAAINAELATPGPWNAGLLTRLLGTLGEPDDTSRALATPPRAFVPPQPPTSSPLHATADHLKPWIHNRTTHLLHHLSYDPRILHHSPNPASLVDTPFTPSSTPKHQLQNSGLLVVIHSLLCQCHTVNLCTHARPRHPRALRLGVLSAGQHARKSIDPRVRAEVTLLRCYLGALVVGSAGYTSASHSLFHHARAALKQFAEPPGFPHHVAFISLQVSPEPSCTPSLQQCAPNYSPHTLPS